MNYFHKDLLFEGTADGTVLNIRLFIYRRKSFSMRSYFNIPGLGVVQASTSQTNIESPILTRCILSSVKNTFLIGSE